MCILWSQHSQEGDWGFPLIDVCNAFNEENRMEIIWAFRHECPSAAQFTFNCNRHWATLVVQYSENESGRFLHRK